MLVLVLVRRGGCDVEGRRKGGRGWGVDVMLKVWGMGGGGGRERLGVWIERTSWLYLPPPFSSSIFSFLSHPYNPPSSILHPPSSLFPYPLSPIPLSPIPLSFPPFLPSSFSHLYPPFPLLTLHSSLPLLLPPPPPPFPPTLPPSSFPLLLPLTHTQQPTLRIISTIFFFYKRIWHI